MSSWIQDISWDDSALKNMMNQPASAPAVTQAPAPAVTQAPAPVVTQAPVPTQPPSYSVNPSYGSNVVMPLPIAPSLLLGNGDVSSALNPLTPPPTEAPVTQADPEPMQYIPPPPPPSFWEKNKKLILAIVVAVLILALIGFVVFRSGKGKNGNKNGNKSGNKNRSKNFDFNLDNLNLNSSK